MSFFCTSSRPVSTSAAPFAGPLISLRNVEKSFDTAAGRSYVLRRITADISPGEFISIMGPSGAGKSTLMSLLGMLDSSWTGEFYLLGQAVHAMPQKQRVALNKRHIGFVFQQYHLIDDLTVAENLDMPLSYRNYRKSEREAMVADVLDRFGDGGKEGLVPAPALRRPAAAGRDRRSVGGARALYVGLRASGPTAGAESQAARGWRVGAEGGLARDPS